MYFLLIYLLVGHLYTKKKFMNNQIITKKCISKVVLKFSNFFKHKKIRFPKGIIIPTFLLLSKAKINVY